MKALLLRIELSGVPTAPHLGHRALRNACLRRGSYLADADIARPYGL